MHLIRFKNVSKQYSKNIAVDDITFDISKKEFITIVGHSGSGKTTMLKLLLGEIFADKGDVEIVGINMSEAFHDELLKIRRFIGIIFQDYRLLNSKTVYENISFAMESLGHSEKKIKSSVPYVLELVDLIHKKDEFPQNLSGGEKQRVAIARAIITQPKILLADEPTGSLDPVNTYEVLNILKQINELGTTVILTTHDKEIVNKIGGRVLTLQDGKLVMDDENGKYIL